MPDRRRPQPSSRDRPGLSELQQEVRTLRRANDAGARPTAGPTPPGPTPRSRTPRAGTQRAGTPRARNYRVRRRTRLIAAATAAAALIILVATFAGAFAGSNTFPAPSNASLAGLSTRERIVAIAKSQVGYATNPSSSYCNKFSAYWGVGGSNCGRGELSEQWCADFAAWAWRRAGVSFAYGYTPGDINAGAASFYRWGVAHGTWHPLASGYTPEPGDVAVYGLRLTGYLTAAHVAVVTAFQPGDRGPDVVNGDGDRTGFSVVEPGTDQVRADTNTTHHQSSALAGYVSPA